MGFTLSHFISQFPPTRFPLLTAIGMCHFLPVHHLGIAFFDRVKRSKHNSTNRSRKTSNGVLSLVNSCFDDRKGKGFLHCIVAGNVKWIHYDNPKRRISWGKSGHASTLAAKPNIHVSKFLFSIWWDQQGVIHYELLKPTEIITGDRYRLQLIRLSRALKKKTAAVRAETW